MNEIPFRILGTRTNPKVGSEEDIDISLDGGPAKNNLSMPEGSVWYITDFICNGTKTCSFKLQLDNGSGIFEDLAFARVGADGTVDQCFGTAIKVVAKDKAALRIRVQGDFDNTRTGVAVYGYYVPAEATS